MTLSETILLVIAILTSMVSFICMLCVNVLRNRLINQHNQVQMLINSLVLNDDLIDQSIQTICQAYHIEEGDLKNYICKAQR